MPFGASNVPAGDQVFWDLQQFLLIPLCNLRTFTTAESQLQRLHFDQ